MCPDGIGDAHVQGYMDIQIDTKIGIYGRRAVPSVQSLAELRQSRCDWRSLSTDLRQSKFVTSRAVSSNFCASNSPTYRLTNQSESV